MLETGFLIGHDGHTVLYRHLPEGRSSAYLPDSDELWDRIWENRHWIGGFAHSHPRGFTGPSLTDLQTFSAVEAALGQRLDWWIVTDASFAVFRRSGTSYSGLFLRSTPDWVYELRRLTYGEQP